MKFYIWWFKQLFVLWWRHSQHFGNCDLKLIFDLWKLHHMLRRQWVEPKKAV